MARIPTALSVLLVALLAGSALAQPNKCKSVSKAVEKEKVSLFLEAVEAAGLTGLVDDKQGELTILAPSDRALTAALRSLKLEKEELFASTKLLTEILSYHILPTAYNSEELVTFGSDDSPFTTLLAGDSSCGVETITVEEKKGTVTIIGGETVADVIATDIQACTSIVHVIDGVLVPCTTDPADLEEEEEEEEEPAKKGGKEEEIVDEEGEMEEEEEEDPKKGKKGSKEEEEIITDDEEEVADPPVEEEEEAEPTCESVIEVVAKRERIFNRALSAARLTEGVADKTAELTIFVPTDKAFQALATALGVSITKLLKDTDLLTEVLTFHVVRGAVTSEDIGKKTKLTPVLGKNSSCKSSDLKLSVEDGDVIVAGGESSAKVVRADVEACSSVIHFIDTVLVPCP